MPVSPSIAIGGAVSATMGGRHGPSRGQCEEMMLGFEDASSTAEQRQMYAQCVEVTRLPRHQYESEIALGIAMIVFIAFLALICYMAHVLEDELTTF